MSDSIGFNEMQKQQHDLEITIERAFEFVRDVLDDPAVLDRLPARAELTITPIFDRRPDTRYDATTRRFAISALEITLDRMASLPWQSGARTHK